MPTPKRTQHIWLQMLLGLTAGVVAGLLSHTFWEIFGLPERPGPAAWGEMVRPVGLKLFVSIGLPAAAVLPSIVLGVLSYMLSGAGPQAQEHCRQAQRLDAYTYLLLAAGVVLILVYNVLGNGTLALGLIYLGLATAKVAILMRLLWRAYLSPVQGEQRPLRRQGLVAVFLTALVAFSLPAPWLSQIISSGGGESAYLMQAHAVTHGQPISLEPGQPGPEQRDFYWDTQTPDEPDRPGGSLAPLFALIIAPAYAVGGRLGVLFLQAALMALSAVTLLSWLRVVGVRAGPATVATGLTLGAAPVFIAGGMVLPEAPAILLTLCALRLLAWARTHPWSALPLLLVACLLLVGLELRYSALAAGLFLMSLFELLRRPLSPWVAGALATIPAVALGLALFGPWTPWPSVLASAVNENMAWWRQALYWWTPLAAFSGGLFLDQAYGLFPAAPVLLLALGGLPFSLKRRPTPSLQYLIPAAMQLAALCFTGWYRWHGGSAPPGLLAVVLVPPAALLMAPVLGALSRPWWRLAWWLPAAMGIIYTWLLTLMPWLRQALPGTPNPLLLSLSRRLGLDLGRALPSGFGAWPELLPATCVALALAVFYGLCAWRLPSPGPGLPSWRANELLILALALCLASWGLVLAASPLP
ncbi:MAG: hypothetical protein KQI62_15345 [Deltaproteobacteria bacterium]|nr:hypothetical protein [Deltaproteobacteria bacterium]